MGRRNTHGAVSIDKDKSPIRLRWRYQSKRYSLNLFLFNKANLLRAKKIALTIENDLVSGAFDYTLMPYKLLIEETPERQPSVRSITSSPDKEISRNEKAVEPDRAGSMLKDFDRYIASKSMDPHSEQNRASLLQAGRWPDPGCTENCLRIKRITHHSQFQTTGVLTNDSISSTIFPTKLS